MRIHEVEAPHSDELWARALSRDPRLRERLAIESPREVRLPPGAPPPPPPEVLDALRRTLEVAGSDPAAEAALGSLERGAWVVTTGQQPGFLGGPLLVLAKAFSALACAATLRRVADRPVVALFWVASEDHDLAEMASVLVPRPGGGFERARAPVADWRRSAARLEVSPEVAAAFDEALAPWSDSSSEALRASRPRPGELWPFAFLRFLGAATRGTGLLPFDPSLARPEARSLLGRAHERAALHREALRRAAERLVRLGLEAPLPLDRSSPIFLDDGTRRRRARSDEGADPARSSPDASLRPVLEATWFPVCAHVGGPGELRYWLQLPEVFALYEVGVPPFVPRHSLSFLDPRAARALRKAAGSPEQVLARALTAAPAEEEASLPPEIERAADRLRAAGEAFEQAAWALGPAAREPASRLRGSLERALARTLQRLTAALEDQRRTGGARRSRIRETLLPGGRPQERVVTSLAPSLWWGDLEAVALVDALAERDPRFLAVVDPQADTPSSPERGT